MLVRTDVNPVSDCPALCLSPTPALQTSLETAITEKRGRVKKKKGVYDRDSLRKEGFLGNLKWLTARLEKSMTGMKSEASPRESGLYIRSSHEEGPDRPSTG